MVAEYLIKMFGCDCLMIVEYILLDSYAIHYTTYYTKD